MTQPSVAAAVALVVLGGAIAAAAWPEAASAVTKRKPASVQSGAAARRLWRAQLALSTRRWLAIRIASGAFTALMVACVTRSPVVAASAALTGVSLPNLYLRLRAGRLRTAAATAAPELARALALELDMGRGAMAALSAVAANCSGSAVANAVAAEADHNLALELPCGAAVAAAVSTVAVGDTSVARAFGPIAALLGVTGQSGRAAAQSLRKFAASIEAEAVLAREIGASAAEARFVAAALPVLTVVIAIVIGAVEPGAVLSLRTPLGMVVSAGSLLVALGGVTTVFWATRA